MNTQTEKAKKGIKWSLIDQIVRQSVTLLISAILSRLLTPAEYGLLGMIAVATGFLQVFKEMGLGSSVVQKQGITTAEQSSIFWLNVAVGLILTLLLLITAPWIARFFNEPQLTILIRVISFNFVIGSMAIVPDALIQKAIDFKSFFLRNLGTVILGGLFGIWLAYRGYGVWALIGQSLITTVTGLVISFRMVQWRPQLFFKWNLLKRHLYYSLPILGDSSINYWTRNIDNLLVGKILGSTSLGIYNRAYSLMLLPIKQISSTLSRVMFPSFALIQNEKNLMWEQYLKVVSSIAMLSFPLMATLGIYARECILIVYGGQWLEVVPLFRILCFLGAIQSIATLAGTVYYSTGKTVLLFKVGIITKTLMISGIVTGLYVGNLKGMVWGYSITSTIAFFLETYYVCSILSKKLYAYLKSLFPEFFASVMCFTLVLIVHSFFERSDSTIPFTVVFIHFLTLLMALPFYIYLLYLFKSKGLQVFMKNYYDKKKANTSFDAR